MLIGVSPFWMVAGDDSTGLKLPAFFSAAKKSRPGLMSSKEPLLARGRGVLAHRT
ncbi:hypothetical protein [Nonomuraea sp. bgisy101]|uniref:hypothetical protein n=1 Tax=Nonomuraea sp. bgisy101 TaxID=3413784 RepID=UPI003D71A884